MYNKSGRVWFVLMLIASLIMFFFHIHAAIALLMLANMCLVIILAGEIKDYLRTIKLNLEGRFEISQRGIDVLHEKLDKFDDKVHMINKNLIRLK